MRHLADGARPARHVRARPRRLPRRSPRPTLCSRARAATSAGVDAMRRALPHDITNALAASALVLEIGSGRRADAVAEGAGVVRRRRPTASSSSPSATACAGSTTRRRRRRTPRRRRSARFDRIVLIAGGYDKGVDLSPMARRAATGSTPWSPSARPAPTLAAPCSRGTEPVEVVAGSMADAVEPAARARRARRHRAALARLRQLRRTTRLSEPAATTSARSSTALAQPSHRTDATRRPATETDHDRTTDRRRSSTRRARAPARSAAPRALAPARSPPAAPRHVDADRAGTRHASAEARARARPAAPAAGAGDGPSQRDSAADGTYYAIAVVVAVFVMLGLVMVLSASAVDRGQPGNSPYRSSAARPCGPASASSAWSSLRGTRTAVAPADRSRSGCSACVAMCLPFVPGLGRRVNGASSWIRSGRFSVQPSEFLKLAVVVLAADLLARRPDDVVEARRGASCRSHWSPASAPACLAQGDLGSAVVLAAIVFSVAWIAGVPVPTSPRWRRRCRRRAPVRRVEPAPAGPLHGVHDVAGEKDHLAYQIYQGYLSIASGGLTGSGIGGGKGKLGYLPYAQSDFIFAVIADELGFVGTAAVVGGFILLVAFGIQTALAAPDRFGMLLAGGIATWFGVQAIVNLGGVVGRCR